MKTHALARALRQLAELLSTGPNVELGSLSTLTPNKSESDSGVGVSLHTLVALSRIDKRRWTQLVNEHGFDIKLNPRDSSRDVMGKLLRFLDKNPAALAKLESSGGAEPSAELLQAFKSLLKDDK